MVLYVPGTEETDPKKQNISLQAIGAAATTAIANVATNTAAIAALQSGTVTTIAGNSGAFTLNGTSGITNTTNDIKLSQASSSQFGAVKVDGTTITASSGVISAAAVSLSKITASLGADVALSNTANYFDGPSVAQGATGTWFVMGTVTTNDTIPAKINAKLWDGTTVIASASTTVAVGSSRVSLTLSGVIVSPAGNLKISVQDASSVNGKIEFNDSGNSKDSTITAIRIA